ncbi:MAG: aldehyde dehydrogenase family protein [Fimbriimonadaceae bacterium]
MVEATSLIGSSRSPKGSEETVTVFAPYDGAAVGTAPLSGPDEVESAIALATATFPAWSGASRHARRALLFRIAALVKERSEELARLMSVEVGKPIAWARAEVARTGLTFGLAASLMDEPEREELHLDFDPRGPDYRCFVSRFPIGPVFGIVPYNWPYNLAAHKLAPALAAGCTIVLKPSSLAPLSTLALVGLIADAGCPPGVVNALLCSNENAEAIVRDERIRLVSFTGSEKVGWHLRSLVSEKPVVLEMGGDASVLVFDDADLGLAVSRTVEGAYGYAGQVCISAQHARVQSGVYESVREQLVSAAEAVVRGDPLDENVLCGPLVSSEAADKVLAWVDEAEQAGASVLCGGNRVGNVIEPVLVEGVPPGCKLATEEVFGPVLTLSRFETEDEAFAMVNGSRFGIHCGVFTADHARLGRAYHALDVSGVIGNDYPNLRFDNMPYGGVKRSGIGREGVRYAYDEMSLPKTLVERR